LATNLVEAMPADDVEGKERLSVTGRIAGQLREAGERQASTGEREGERSREGIARAVAANVVEPVLELAKTILTDRR